MLRKLERSNPLEGLSNLRPDEHGGLRSLDVPTHLIQPIYEHVPAGLICIGDFFYALLRPVQRDDGRDLDRLKHAVVEVALDLDEGAHHVLVPRTETHAPAGHVVALSQAVKLDTHFFRASGLQEAWCTVAVEVQVRVGQIMNHHDIILAGKVRNLLKEGYINDRGGRIVREIDNQHLGPGPGVLERVLHVGKEIAVFPQGYGPHFAARDDHTVWMDGIGRRGGKYHVTWFNRGQGQMGQPFL